jgi:hypothetical protein
MAGENTVASLNGNFKEVYEDQIKNLIPDGVYLYNEIPFVTENKQTGNKYHQPVVLGLEHGFTYGGTAGSAFTLNNFIAGQMKDAEVQGTELVLRSAISIGAASRAGNDKNSFERATKHVVANMIRSISRRLEVSLLYGQSSLGVLSANNSGVLTISDDSWASGIWSGAEGMIIEAFDAVASATQHDGDLTISAVNFDNKTVTVTGTSSSVVATDFLFIKGAFDGTTHNDFAGLYKIITNTGTLFGISAASYNLWSGNNVSTAQDISFAAIENAIAKGVAKGLSDQDVCVLVNVDHWSALLVEQDAKRQYDSSYKKDMMEAGAKHIEFFGQNGMIKIVPSIYVKGAHAFIVPMDELIRIGSTDVTFEIPGRKDEFFKLLESSNGYELRCYTDQALFCAAPGKCVILSDLNVA